jgi:hypothetical protein
MRIQSWEVSQIRTIIGKCGKVKLTNQMKRPNSTIKWQRRPAKIIKNRDLANINLSIINNRCDF